jgi:hypothetical protein
MSYFEVKHADTSIPAYNVYDHTTNTDTSLAFPGRYVSGYSQTVAENFLHLLENFASDSEPSSPQVGQLWYNTASGFLQVRSDSGWKAASGIEYKDVNPGPAEKPGQLWVDTANRQLNIYTGSSWMVVGPAISTRDGLKNGAVIEELKEDGGKIHSVLMVYISDTPIAIVSKTEFTPNPGILGFNKIYAGVTLNKTSTGSLPVFFGTATAATKLVVNNTEVASNKFLRTDTINNTDFAINIKHNDGLAVGTNRNLILSYSANTNIARLYNSSAGSIDLQTQVSGAPKTVLKVTGSRVGINNVDPQAAFDVTGNTIISGQLTIKGIDGVGLDITGKISKGAIVDQNDLSATTEPSVKPTDQIALYRSGDLLNKTTVANLLASVQQQTPASSVFSSRKTLQQTTQSIESGPSILLTIPGGYKGYALYSITASSPARVRVYSSKDAGKDPIEMNRAIGTTPAINSGVIAEANVTTANEVVHFTPAAIGYSAESTPNNDIIVRVTNTGPTEAAITVKLTILQLEA